MVALAGMLGRPARAADKPPEAARGQSLALPGQGEATHLRHMNGALPHHDTFDYKPQLVKDDGKAGPGGGTLTASKFKWKQHGQTGSWFSELLPNLARHADELTWLRGLHTDTPAHPQAVVQTAHGQRERGAHAALTRPSMGAWLLYGLGTENEDLPGYVTINPPPNFGGAVNYGSAFLPAHFQGTRINDQRLSAEPARRTTAKPTFSANNST